MSELPEITKVIVVDDHPLFRRGVVQLLSMEPTFEVVAEAGTHDEALLKIMQKLPDLAVLDLNMKGTSGLEILSAIKKFDPSIKVVMLTVSDAPSDLLQCLRAGADGYLLKDQNPEEILENLTRTIDGENVLSPALKEILAESIKEELLEEQRDLTQLTDRELDVLEAVGQGKNNKEIARDFGISDATVKVYVKHIFKKLSFRSRVEVAIWVNDHLLEIKKTRK